ncbi:MAG TPA: VOC family protein [Solirubrobacteraceae bacterium]|nr:VOC family protein [Solirubrobacteraceae bacterium]
MSSAAAEGDRGAGPPPADRLAMRLEVVVLPVADVDRAKDFYEGLGWRLDANLGEPGSRVVQLTPPHSPASIIFGEGITTAPPGSIDTIVLVVEDIEAAREELLATGVDVSGVMGGSAGFDRGGSPGRDPQGRSYFTYIRFEDPDGNGWLLQEITERLPGRLWREEEG